MKKPSKKKSKPEPKEPTPMLFKRARKPDKELMQKLKDQVMAMDKGKYGEQKQPSAEKDKPMPSKKQAAKDAPKRERKTLSNEQGLRMIREWDTKTVQEWADEFGVSYQTVGKMAAIIREKDTSLCPKKTAKRRTREDIADAWIALYKKGEKK